MLNFEGQKVLITGATGGIGSATAKLFAKLGANLGLCGRNEKKLEDLANEVRKYGNDNIQLFVCDLSNIDEVNSLVDQSDTQMDGIDILICNAGITKDMLAIRMNNNDFESVLDVNLKATFVLNRDMVKKMIKRRYGRIINISSIVGVMGNPGQANYVASKAGMIGMSKSLAYEVASRNITVNCVAPGFIETPMTDVLTKEQKSKMLANIPVGRIGSSDDIASSIAFLASKEASYITGQTLHVNGGMLMI